MISFVNLDTILLQSITLFYNYTYLLLFLIRNGFGNQNLGRYNHGGLNQRNLLDESNSD